MDAEDWLMDTERKLNTSDAMTWRRESNVPESIMELKRREFESLEQKDKAILTYVREFSGLSRYAVEEVNTEDKKKKRFMRGLNPQFKLGLVQCVLGQYFLPQLLLIPIVAEKLPWKLVLLPIVVEKLLWKLVLLPIVAEKLLWKLVLLPIVAEKLLWKLVLLPIVAG
ncbi:hypothetical protein QYE76_041991 [Lolium multiflorum]|uniref:Retrotransposon gag domain-containing protein n=1 Tax=Lolium multiflorum TaxID=4521 RepID=A0AAD8TGC7_LOLMU|nr:hypothetical protein QYE76_041991 [Lolium multiflorum]